VPSLIRNPKDFMAGAIFTAAGLAAVLLGRQYSMGTATRMGPAYFPTTLGLVLVLIGLVVLARSFLQRGEPIQGLAVRPMLLIIGATVLFGALLRGAGLLIALVALVVLSAWASRQFRWPVALALGVGLAAFSALMFVTALGLPLPLVGSWLRR
jgi:putative tricarboxylic transport membrane protein